MKRTVVVFGGGPAGLTAGWRLATQGHTAVVVEREPGVGGMAATFRWKDYLLEFGPHAYHNKGDEVDEIVRSLCRAHLAVRRRCEKMVIRGKHYTYPLRFWEVVTGLNPVFSAKMVLDFAATSAWSKFDRRPKESFEAWGVASFGRTLYKLCFGDYSTKVWGMSPTQLSAKLFLQKIHRFTLKDILLKLLNFGGTEQLEQWKQFLYPEQGIGEIFERMRADIDASGGQVLLRSTPARVTRQGSGLLIDVQRQDGTTERIEASEAISTIPIKDFVPLISDHVPRPVVEAARDLRYRALIIVYVVFETERIGESHWVYLLDPQFRFNRYCEQKNLGPGMAPADRTVVSFEICCNWGDALWRAPAEEVAEMVKRDIAGLKEFRGKRIVDVHLIRLRDAYPIYDIGYDTRMERVLGYLKECGNLLSVGRQGLFLNNDIHDSMEMGLMAADVFSRRTTSPPELYEQITQAIARRHAPRAK